MHKNLEKSLKRHSDYLQTQIKSHTIEERNEEEEEDDDDFHHFNLNKKNHSSRKNARTCGPPFGFSRISNEQNSARNWES